MSFIEIFRFDVVSLLVSTSIIMCIMIISTSIIMCIMMYCPDLASVCRLLAIFVLMKFNEWLNGSASIA
jgi:hypothetical protein